MKALTIRQPWASLIALGVKTIETRSWSTNYRGPLAIHAGKKAPTGIAGAAVGNFIPWFSELHKGYVMGPNKNDGEFDHLDVFDLPLGAVVATCELVDVIATYPYMAIEHPDQVPYGDFSPLRFAWVLDKVVAIKTPIRVNGRQGLWYCDEVAA